MIHVGGLLHSKHELIKHLQDVVGTNVSSIPQKQYPNPKKKSATHEGEETKLSI
jgi:hypothetical protein